MAEKSSFGMDDSFVETLDFDLALKRISIDIRSDFIIAPHLSCIYLDAKEELIQEVKKLLKDGKFSPQLQITIDVPKKHRLKTHGIKRLPPNFVRPGGILWPRDRLLYQALADKAQPLIEKKLDRKICFSHLPSSDTNSEHMFRSNRDCWNNMQVRLAQLASETYPVVLKADIASCFQSINQHTLVNNLESIGFPKEGIKPLESMLTQMGNARSSRGILQGIFPSDLFGNFYLYPIDRFFSDSGINSIRYVDDIYAFFKNHDECDKFIVDLYGELRRLDLYLNEAKSFLMTPVGLLTSDPDLDSMFSSAVDEIQSLYKDNYEEIDTGYGFQTIWDPEDSELDYEEIELLATERLYDELANYPDNTEEIERFCLPMFAAFNSDYALEDVLNKVENTPSMSQIYFSYLSNFLTEDKVISKITEILKYNKLRFKWEYLWVLACVIKLKEKSDELASLSLSLAKDSLHESVTALAYIAAAKHGDYDRQKSILDALISTQSDYIRGAILFSSRYMHKSLRKIAIDQLENQKPFFAMIAKSVKNSKIAN